VRGRFRLRTRGSLFPVRIFGCRVTPVQVRTRRLPPTDRVVCDVFCLLVSTAILGPIPNAKMESLWDACLRPTLTLSLSLRKGRGDVFGRLMAIPQCSCRYEEDPELASIHELTGDALALWERGRGEGTFPFTHP